MNFHEPDVPNPDMKFLIDIPNYDMLLCIILKYSE